LHRAANKYDGRLLALPISYSAHELDDKIIDQLIYGQNHRLFVTRKFDTPLEVIRKIRRCRLVVAGTFHAAVFALAQGIPAIGLVKSTQYIDKFLGLADQFGPGCQVVYLNTGDFQAKLLDAIDFLWTSAEQLRPQLLDSARLQIHMGREAYQRLYELVENKRQ